MDRTTPGSSRNMLYQTGTIRSILKGVYTGDMRFEELAQYGDFGLGTFDKVNGEMVALEGKFYRIDSRGTAHVVDLHLKTPFSVVTRFVPTISLKLGQLDDLLSVQKHLESCLESPNIIYALRLTGRFNQVEARSEHPQSQEGLPLAETIAELQTTFRFQNLQGDLIGFWFPEYMRAINVPGFHFHFLDASRRVGGHVFDVRLDCGVLEIMPIFDFGMHLLHTPLFEHVNLNTSDAGATEKVERKSD
jgi:acetolactate decarboxylase